MHPAWHTGVAVHLRVRLRRATMLKYGFGTPQETPWTLLLTQTSGTADIDGTNNPFAVHISGSEPSTTTKYARNWTSVLTPKTRDEFKLVRGSNGDFVVFVVDEWCGWDSTEAACGGTANLSSVSPPEGCTTPPAFRSDVRSFHTCFGLGCGTAGLRRWASRTRPCTPTPRTASCATAPAGGIGAVKFHWGSSTRSPVRPSPFIIGPASIRRLLPRRSTPRAQTARTAIRTRIRARRSSFTWWRTTSRTVVHRRGKIGPARTRRRYR